MFVFPILVGFAIQKYTFEEFIIRFIRLLQSIIIHLIHNNSLTGNACILLIIGTGFQNNPRLKKSVTK
jgi:hypothetical protein